MLANEIKIIIKNQEGERLVGLKGKPNIKFEKYSTVLLVHGFHVTKEEGGMFDNLAEVLTKEGYLVYRFDFSGCGESDGDYSKTSLTKLKNDLEKIINFIKSEPEVDRNKIGILAQSFGTSVTLALRPKVKTIVLMGTIIKLKEIFKKLFGDSYNPKGISTKIRSSGRITTVNFGFWVDLNKYDLLETVNNFKPSVLLIHGSEDISIPIENSRLLFNSLKNQKEFLILKGADHSLNPCREQMHEAVINWFGKYLK